MVISNGLVRAVVTPGIASLLILLAASVSRSCDTPVYRYAMYRWFPAPYEVYGFHKGGLAEVGERIKVAIGKAAESSDAPSNIVFIPVDLAEDDALAGVPPDVKAAWLKQNEPSLPHFLVSSPIGGHLFMGSLSPKDIPALVDSPLRQRIGALIKEGKAGVYVLLKSADEAANTAAESVLRGVVNDVASGEIQLYTMPPAYGAYGAAPSPRMDGKDAGEGGKAGNNEQEQAEHASGPTIGLVTLSRDDPQEKWFVDSLLTLEPDLRESKEPIVFMIYGRGRALFSCLGKGIRRDNLIMDVEFITGACSCTVKNMNPGVDLLMSYNWDKAAEAIYQQYGAEEGSPYGYGYPGAEEYPELIIPPESPVADQESKTSESDVDAGGAGESASTVVSADVAASSGSEQTEKTGKPETARNDAVARDRADPGTGAERAAAAAAVGTATDVASRTPFASTDRHVLPRDSGSAPSPSAFRGIMWVGGGLLGILVVLFGITFVVLRPK